MLRILPSYGLILMHKQWGIYLTCLGVGMGNYKDSKLEVLAKRGNGNFSYLDDIAEAEKVLVKELTQNFYSIADDVYLDVDFNPAYVKEYRLIGFDNKKDAIQDSTSELEGGDIGTASSMMAIFELLPQHPGDIREKPLLNSSFAKVNLRYSLCKDTSHTHKIVDCPFNYSEFSSLDPSLQFASAVTMFGLKLRQSKFAQDIEWDQIISLATNATQPGNYLQLDFLKLLAKAKKVYEVKKKKKKKSDDD